MRRYPAVIKGIGVRCRFTITNRTAGHGSVDVEHSLHRRPCGRRSQAGTPPVEVHQSSAESSSLARLTSG